MTTIDALSEVFIRLFLRIDGAKPTDPVLQAASDLWTERRGSRVMPTAATFGHIPAIIAPHVFHAHLAINGEERWIVSRVGSYARDEIGVGDGRPIDVGDKRMAVRLRKLFELVAERNEPYSVMFEAVARTDERRLVEVYAAPLATHETREHHIFAAINSRSEAAR